jgi:hypothetical protein
MTAQEPDPAGAIETFIRTGLGLVGIPADDAEIAVMIGVDGLYRPLIQALLEAELDDVVPERGADVSKPPADA